MKFTRIILQNFGRIKQADVALSDRGLVLIQGQNLDGSSANSNGAGKSTLVEAISWALFGKTAKGVTGDSVINRAVGKNCSVTLHVQDEEDEYIIARGRKHAALKSKLHVTTGDGKTDLTKGTDKLTQDMVNKIIGCPYEVFTSAVYSGQESVPDLPSMTDKQLKLLIEEAAGITELEEAYNLARDKARGISDEYEASKRAAEEADRAVDHAHVRIEDAERTAKRWEGEREARIMDLDAKARLALDQAKHLKEDLAKHSSMSDLEEALTKARESQSRLDRESDKEKELQKALSAAEHKVAGIEAEIGVIKRQLAKAKEYQAEVEGQIGQPCEACGRNHDTTSLESAIEYAKGKVAEIAGEARPKIKALEDARTDAESARESLERYREGMTDPAHLATHRAKIETRIRERRRKEREAEQARETAATSIETLKTEKTRENPYLDDIEERKSDHKAVVEERAEIRKTLNEVKQRARVAKGVVEVFSPRGVRARILDTVTPYLNERTAHYLGALSDGKLHAAWSTVTLTAKGEPREKFAIEAKDLTDGGNFTDLSGGEKRRVRLSCALALQDMVATRAAKPIDFWCGDEIDAALDTAGLERLMNVLEEKARERGSIFVISHSDLKSWISNGIKVVREDGVARVEEFTT